MCLPIAPNERHPLGREPLRTDPPFPFPSCYHWVSVNADVRVRARHEGFNTNDAVRLPPEERVRMRSYWNMDIADCEDARRDRQLALFAYTRPGAGDSTAEASATGTPLPPHDPTFDRSALGFSADAHEQRKEDSECADTEQVPDHASAGSDSSSVRSSLSADTVDGIIGLGGVFGAPSHNPELLPLVDLWLDLSGRITAEAIPDPMDFYKECYEVSKYVCYCPLSVMR